MILLAYESVAGHGLALPLFKTSPTANALYVAVPSRPGDPSAVVRAFDVLSVERPVPLDASLHRNVSIGALWVDVFVWDGVAHVGTKEELWELTASVHQEMERKAPFSLLALAEGADRGVAARCALVVYNWLARDWGAQKANHWRLHTYLDRLARRDLARHSDQFSTASTAIGKMKLVQKQGALELLLPPIAKIRADDLPNLNFAADALGWRLDLIFDRADTGVMPGDSAEVSEVLVMRLRHGRGRTQTQIPLRVFDGFLGGNATLQDVRTGRPRTMTLSRSNGARNTMKLQLSEIAHMSDPVARFTREADGIRFEVYDANSAEGRPISDLLDEGLRNGSTLKTQGGATWWRIVRYPRMTSAQTSSA